MDLILIFIFFRFDGTETVYSHCEGNLALLLVISHISLLQMFLLYFLLQIFIIFF